MVHWIAHLFHWQRGTVETWWDGNKLFVGFKCSVCGKISGIAEIRDRMIRG